MLFARRAAVFVVLASALAVPVVARADDGWEKRLEANVAKLEEAVKKIDGKAPATGKLDARLTALDIRIADLEVKAGRSKGSETIPTTGEQEILLGKWTTVCTHLTSRFQDSQRPAKPNTKGDGTPTPDPSTLVASGTGFFITVDGELATCAHVVQAGKSYRIATETGQYAATVVKVDKDRDLAILRVKGTFTPIPICPSAEIRLGAMVGTVGYPNPELQGKSPKATKGEISSLAGLKDDEHEFQVSLPIQPGNSGGALFDARGNVVGIVAATLNQDVARLSSGVSAQNVNYAIKSAYLLKLIASVPGLKERLPASCAEEQKFEDVVALAQKATGMVLVYESAPEAATTPGPRPSGRAMPTTIEELDLFPENFVGKVWVVDQVWLHGDLNRYKDTIILQVSSAKGKYTHTLPMSNGIAFTISALLAQKILAFGLSANTQYVGRLTFDVRKLGDDWIAPVREISFYAKNGTILRLVHRVVLTVPPEPTTTRADFAARVIALMREQGLQGEITHDEIEGRLVHAIRGPFDLEQAYQRFAGPDRRPDSDEMLTRVVRLYAIDPKIPQTWDEAKREVRPYLYPMSFQVARAFKIERGEEQDPSRYAALTEHVTVGISVPLEDAVAQVSDTLLAKWGVDFEDALNRATTNLARQKTPAWKASPDYPGVFRSPWGDRFDAARILVPDALRSVALRGDPVIVIHAPSCVLMAGADDPDGLFQLGRCAKKQWELNHGTHLSRAIRRHAGTFAHWLPPKNHAAYSLLRLMSAINERRDYEDLQSVTRERLEQQGISAATPQVQIVQSAIGDDTKTVATWGDKTATALPEVDGIVFKRGGEALGVAEFSDVRRVLGAGLEPLTVYPKRWLGRTFPSQEQLDQMGLVPWRHREA